MSFAIVGFVALLACVFGAPVQAEPKRIYIANDDHTDYFWTGTDAEYRTAFLSMLDYYMNQAEATATNPPHARGRFNCDGSVWVWEYERNKPAASFDRLVQHLRAGTITMPLNTCVLLHGTMPVEATLRNMYYAGRLERRYGLRFPMAVSMENQTLPGGIASLWAGSGALYSWKGICHCATRIDAANRPRDIYHFVGPDGQSVCMKWSRFVAPDDLGGYGEAGDPPGVVAYMDDNPTFQSHWPWPITAAFGYGTDTLNTRTPAFVNTALAMTDTSRTVIVSNEQDFFADFLSHHGGAIPSFSGAFGNEWDLYSASMGELTADVKREVEKLRTAEALATLASLYDASFMNGRTVARDSAFLACGLYYEHDWTSDGPRSSLRPPWQRRMRDAIARYVDPLLADGLTRLGTLVPSQGAERYVVFNAVSWKRTDVADLPAGAGGPRYVVDVATGSEVPSQSIVVGGVTRLRVLAADVPPLGYKVFEVRSGAGTTFPPSATVTLPSLDNGRYRVTLGTRGQITSLIEHAAGGDREWVKSGGALHDLNMGSGAAVLEASGPVSTVLRVTAPGTYDHETRVTLHAGLDRVDIDGRVTENFNTNLYYRSAVALTTPTLRHEEVGMIARIARAAAGGDYADQNTRTDWLTFNHFLDLSDASKGLTVSNWDSPFVRIGSSTPTTLDATSSTFDACIGMQPDGGGLGVPSQGGDSFFLNRYALRAHGAYDAGAAMRFALEHQNPLVAVRATGGAAPLPAASWSMLSVADSNVIVWAVKPAEDGIAQGVVVRVWNVTDAPRSLALSFTPGIAAATRTTHIETDLAPATQAGDVLLDDLARQQLRTYRLRPGSAVGVEDVSAGTAAVRLAVSPNPSSGDATIAFALPARAPVRLTVHDVRGRRVAMLADAALSAGRHAFRWNGRQEDGAVAPPGLYFVKLKVGGRRESARIALLR